MKRIHLSTLVACFFLFSFSSLKAQHETYQPALWISMGWGAGDGPHVIEDYNLLSLGAQLQTKHKILILRLENGWDYAAATRQSYTVEAYKILCGYYKDFQDSQLYLATGISYSSHNFSGRYIDKALVAHPAETIAPRPSNWDFNWNCTNAWL